MQNSPSDNVAHFAHLGGALIGIIIVLYWQKAEIVFLMSLIDQLKYQFNTGGTYLKIIYINVGVFIVFLLLNVFSALMKASNMIDIVPLFELNSSPSIFLFRPWTFISYMFVHLSIGHLFWNMILYFFAGRIFEDLLGKRQL